MGINPDFKDLFAALSAEGAEFLLVGGYAVMVFTEPRFTKDLDIWVHPSPENAQRVWRALASFGAPMESAGLTLEDLARPGTIFQMGVPPNRIDVLTSVDGVDFQAAWQRRHRTTYGGVELGVMALEDLVLNKRTVGRPQDLEDVARLERAAVAALETKDRS